MQSRNPKEQDWFIELAAMDASGRMVRNHFVQVTDEHAIKRWCDSHPQDNVYTSIAQFRQPNRISEYRCPFFLDFDVNVPDKALNELINASQVLQHDLGIDPMSMDFFFSGTGAHIVVDLLVFGNPKGPHVIQVWQALACYLTAHGVAHIDQGIYQPSRLWRKPNTLNTKSGLYKVPLEYAELVQLTPGEILELAGRPREWDCMADPQESPKAIGWFLEVEHQLTQAQPVSETCNPQTPVNGWQRPPCIEQIETVTLQDGTRHAAYFALARFYASAGASPSEILKRLKAIDQRNPIKDPDYIERIARTVHRHGFTRCPAAGFHQFCHSSQCHLPERTPTIQQERKSP